MIESCAPRSLALALTLILAPAALGQQAKPAAPPAAAASDGAVVATVGELKITKADVLKLLSQYDVPAGRGEEVYRSAVDALVNRALLRTFLDRERVGVTDAQINTELETMRAQLKESGRDLNSLLAESNLTPAELREQIGLGLRWGNYLKAKVTDQVLRDYFQKNIDQFTGAQVKASHILVKVEPDASEDAKQKARQRLVDLKQQIVEKKISFVDAANKYSEDEGNRETPDGGNLDYFTKRGQYIDAFCDAAFAMKVGEISDPVETEYGFHLIQVTDRKPGQDIQYEAEGVKEQIQQIHGGELQTKLIEETRKATPIDIKPMPEGFFPPAAAAVPGAAAPG